MLNRQKTLLFLLQAAGRPVQRMELTKWCFLLRHEFGSAGGSAFYDFVPYRFGPFSFGLYQEAGKLEQNGYLVAPDGDSWTATDIAAHMAPPSDVLDDVVRLLSRWKRRSLESLVDYVYERYPAFTVNSERRKLAERPKTSPAVFTAGYESLSVDAFLNLLVESGIERLIDVRQNPVARRYGFHRSTLSILLGRLGIDYVHVPELGIPSSFRQQLATYADYERLFKKYEAKTLSTEESAIGNVARLVAERPSVLVCMEADPEYCHRSRLASRVAAETSLPVTHLRAH
jgi:uncharacterized protein (DUF488 family)